MPKESENLKLKLYNAVTDAKELAVNWFNNIFDYSNSNWVKIDDAYKEITDKIADVAPAGYTISKSMHLEVAPDGTDEEEYLIYPYVHIGTIKNTSDNDFIKISLISNTISKKKDKTYNYNFVSDYYITDLLQKDSSSLKTAYDFKRSYFYTLPTDASGRKYNAENQFDGEANIYLELYPTSSGDGTSCAEIYMIASSFFGVSTQTDFSVVVTTEKKDKFDFIMKEESEITLSDEIMYSDFIIATQDYYPANLTDDTPGLVAPNYQNFILSDGGGLSLAPASYYLGGVKQNYMSGLDIDKDGNIKAAVGNGLKTEASETYEDSGQINVIPATASSIGGVIIGDGVSVKDDGTISIPAATTTTRGTVSIGNGINVTSDGVISVKTDTTLKTSGLSADAKETGDALNDRYTKEEADNKFGTPYTLPVATSTTLGGVRVGDGLNVTEDGILSVSNDTSALSAYPIGSIYQSIVSTSPAELFGGTWQQIARNRVLMGVDDTHVAGETVDSGLPNIKGDTWLKPNNNVIQENGPFYLITTDSTRNPKTGNYNSDSTSAISVGFDASKYDSIYGASDIVQPPAYYVYTWQRVGHIIKIKSDVTLKSVTIIENDKSEPIYNNDELISSNSKGLVVPINDTIEGVTRNYKITVGISGDELTNYKDITETKEISVYFGNYFTTTTVEFTFAKVFGVVWDYSSSSTALTRLTTTSDPNKFVTVDITSEPVPAVGTGSGSSPFDEYMPWAGMKEYTVKDSVAYGSSNSNFSRTYNDMVKIPIFYYKVIDDATNKKRYFYVTSSNVSGFEGHPAGGAFVGRYNITGTSTEAELSEGSGTDGGHLVPAGGYKRSELRDKVKSLDKHGWLSLFDYASWCAICLLYIVEYADWNIQAKIGKGNCSSGTSLPTGNGYTDTMTYHTGRASGTDGNTSVQYRWIENLWGGGFQFIDGINLNGTKIYVSTRHKNYTDDTSDNYTDIGNITTTTNSGFISSLGYSETAPWAFYPTALSGSNSTYIPDACWKNNSGWRILDIGGGTNSGLDAGLFCFDCNTTSSTTNSLFIGRAQYKPQS